jgi:septum formation protein
MRTLGVPFSVVASRYEEMPDIARTPRAIVRAHARGKAADVAPRVRNAVVIGADTIVWLAGTAYGKPRTLADARRMLRALQGRTHTVHTGLAVCDTACGRWIVDSVCTRVTMRPLGPREIDRYFDLVDPLDKAGAYAIQDAGGIIVERIHGCYYNVIGFPIATLETMLRRLDYSLLAGGQCA